MKYNILGYLIGEGFSNFVKNKKSTGASLMIMCATMIIFGIFLVLTQNLNHFVKEIEHEQGIQVYIENAASDEQIKEMGEKIRGLEGVNTAEFVSKEDALNQMKEKFGDKKDLLAGYDSIFPASYIVKLTDLNLSKQVQEQISQMENVKKITSKDETVTALLNLANGIRIFTGAILVLLVIISTFIIANTIKLTVHARRKEISIMKYVGATNGFIRWPFIVEGMLIGIISSIISIVLVGGIYSLVAEKIVNSQFMKVINMSLVTFGEMFSSIIFVYMLLGIGIGVVGSMISMRKYLKV